MKPKATQSIAGWFALMLLLTTLDALALGLGEVRVDSFLNQPLDARIRLLDASPEDLESLTAGLAGDEDYQRLGLMSSVLSLDLAVEVGGNPSAPVLILRSRRPVTDPVLQLLIDVRWAGGRLLREYTLFLDPATIEVAPPPPPPAAVEVPPVRAPAAPPPRPSPPARAQAPRVQASADRYGPVAGGETLWTIASQTRPADDLSMDQVMLAFVDLNPRAFRDGNINRLLRGAELRVPTAEQARVRSARQAAAEVAAQNRDFRAGVSRAPIVSDAGRDASTPAASSSSESPAPAPRASEPRLSLVPPEGNPEAAGTGRDDATLSSLQQRLARAEEELYAARQESEEFRERVAELERLVRAQAEGLAVEEADLAALEASLRESRAGRDGQAGSDQLARSPAASDDAYVTPENLVGDDESAADASIVETAAAPAPEPSPVEARPPASAPGLLANPLLLGALALIALVLVVVAIALVRRRRVEDGAAAAATAPHTRKDPVTQAREDLARRPNDLQVHLRLLKALAGASATTAFATALEAMYEQVDDDNDPAWREALDLGVGVVPDHALVKGSSDWIASRDAGEDAPDPKQSLDEDTRVDDLMARLEDDFDDSGDDSDWLTEELDATPDAPDEGPRLREPDPPVGSGLEPVTGSAATAGASSFDSDDDQVPLPELNLDEPNASAQTDAGEDDDDLVLDWPDAADDDSKSAPAAQTDDESDVLDFDPAKPQSPKPRSGPSSDSDIFAQTEDDIEVKLDLARAYLSWNTPESARALLHEILNEGNDAQCQEARRLLDDLGEPADDDPAT
ncbi:MAG: FimV/HubP family polar landmark protein [Wenzhouxiangellaceae bacterium]|nr:FimV/HubP family polar landmark protein [Wenzhouxiangellaceae bacterium]